MHTATVTNAEVWRNGAIVINQHGLVGTIVLKPSGAVEIACDRVRFTSSRKILEAVGWRVARPAEVEFLGLKPGKIEISL